MIKTKFIETNELYDGSQLRSLFAYLEHGVLGDSIVAWQGPCQVSLKHMVDGEDFLAGAQICGSSMVHFILEKWNTSLLAAVALQRLLAHVVREVLIEQSSDHDLAKKLRREGDDLYVENLKLSISIATVSPLSALIHFAVNVSNQGTPVPTLSLEDLKVEPKGFAWRVMQLWSQEFAEIQKATQKVQWVR